MLTWSRLLWNKEEEEGTIVGEFNVVKLVALKRIRSAGGTRLEPVTRRLRMRGVPELIS